MPPLGLDTSANFRSSPDALFICAARSADAGFVYALGKPAVRNATQRRLASLCVFTLLVGGGGALVAAPAFAGVPHSFPAELMQDVAPNITLQPSDRNVSSSETAVFLAQSDADPVTVQWQSSIDGGETFQDIEGATEAVYTFNPTSIESEALYRAVFTNDYGSTASDSARLTVEGVATEITTQPEDATVDEGSVATFTAHATGDQEPTGQWQVSVDNGETFTDIPGATSDTYSTGPTTSADDGVCYAAVFTNNVSSMTTFCAALFVNPPPIAMPPEVASAVTATQSGPGQVTVAWNPPTSDGGSAVTGYVAGYSTQQSTKSALYGATVHKAVFSGLATGPYSFSVWAYNAIGIGDRVSISLTLRSAATENVSRSVLTAGESFTVSGVGSVGDRLTLERAIPGQGYRAIASYTVDRYGRYSGSVGAMNSAAYRVRGSTGLLSRSLNVVAQNRLTLAAGRNGLRTYTLSGTIYPAVKGQSVKLYAHQKRTGVYKPLATVTTDAAGRWHYKRTYPRADTWAFEAVSAVTALNASKLVTLLAVVR
jgi:hypothetical protein